MIIRQMCILLGCATSYFMRTKQFGYGSLAICFCFLMVLATESLLLAEEAASNLSQTSRTSLSGKVTSEDGAPLFGAVVIIEGVIARSNRPEVASRSAPECLQSAYTNDAGRFVILDLNPEKRYRLRIAKRSYESRVVSDVSADSQELKISLESAPPDARRGSTVTVDVVDEYDRPIGAAIVQPRGYDHGDEGMLGPMEKIASVQVTNSKGLCDITAAEIVDFLYFEVRAKGFATCFTDKVPLGLSEVQTLRLNRGVTIVGQVFHKGRPLPNVIMGAVPIPRFSSSYPGPWEGITDAEGRFSIANVTAESDVYVYGKINSFELIQGTLAATRDRTGASGTTLDVGELTTEIGYSIAGKVLLKDGNPIPAGWRVNLTRKDLDDAKWIPLKADGTFNVDWVPTGICRINVYGPEAEALSRWGYHLAQENSSLDPTNPFGLVGRVEQHSKITLLLEPGPTTLFEMPETEPDVSQLANKLDKLHASPIAGVPE